ncbi:MAG TPA: ABC transporter ATP-binding protein [Streptosporangiaceae bacterium]|jgi:oligopeptide/dipeptide ABC transporter ATP-binding protein
MALLGAEHLNVGYQPSRGQRIWAVRDVDLALEQGEFVGIVGESGSGKTTLGHALTRMLRPPAHLESGVISFDGTDIASLRGERLRRQRRNGFALVLQSGMNALNPVRTIARQFGDVLKAHAQPGEDTSVDGVLRSGTELLAAVRLGPEVLRRFPHELSGGMRQRVSIALALALQPRLIVFDEPTTALDVIVQQAVMQTIKDLQRDRGFTAVLISHDLGVVLDTADRVVVMYAGRIVEDKAAAALTACQHERQGLYHPYTEALLGCYADPRADVVRLAGIPGTPPDLSLPQAGCSFAPRCPLAEQICRDVDPPLSPLGPGRVACHVRARTANVDVEAGRVS